MNKRFTIVIVAAVFLSLTKVYGQGCVAVRQMGGNTMTSLNSYNLPKGEFQIGTTYRYFHSWRHFIGTEEQEFRQTTQGGFDANGNEKGNAVNIYSHAIDLNISYAVSNRLQLNLAIPYVNNERSQVLKVQTGGPRMLGGEVRDSVLVGQRYSVYASGLGDIRFSANYWIFNPDESANGNLMVGLGIKTNSGSYTETDDALTLDSETGEVVKENQTMDQAIQPGDGGIGFSVEVQGFKKLHNRIFGFANGYYLFNPRESNGTYKSKPKVVKDDEGNVLGTMTGYNLYASPDQFFMRAGALIAVDHAQQLTVSLAGRFEGIPAYDVFGGQVAYRRPGYVGAVETGVYYAVGKHNFGLIIPFNVVRNRIQSAADIAEQNLINSSVTNESDKVHVQGDAAFADYSINFTYAYRLGKVFKKSNPF